MDLGFHKDNVVIIRARSMSPQTRDTFERTLRNQPGILAVTASSYVPLDGNDSNSDVHVPGSADQSCDACRADRSGFSRRPMA